MKTITQYQCEVCKVCYLVKELAEACERHAPKPLGLKIGQEVKLKNRNTGYTLAVLKGLHLISRHSLYANTTPEIMDKWRHMYGDDYLNNIEFHDWSLELDRMVSLDHHWEHARDDVEALYLLTEDEAKNMKRNDNYDV